jgi:DNA-binding transcriptional MerR regulator
VQIGRLSRESGVSVRMLRYYEDQSLLHPKRTLSGYRFYGKADIDTVTRIVLLNKAGLTLESIRRLGRRTAVHTGSPCAPDGAA